MTRTAPVRPVEQVRAAPPQRWTRDRVENTVFGVLRWVVIVVLLAVTLLPFYYMVVLSVRRLDEVIQRPALLWPGSVDLSTYVSVLASPDAGGQGFLVFLRNSAVIALLTVAVTLLAAIPGAYAISRLEFFGRRQVSALFLAENRPRWTVSLGLSQLAGSIEIPTTVLMAGSVLLTLPIVVLFFLAERLLVEGLTSGAEKG